MRFVSWDLVGCERRTKDQRREPGPKLRAPLARLVESISIKYLLGFQRGDWQWLDLQYRLQRWCSHRHYAAVHLHCLGSHEGFQLREERTGPERPTREFPKSISGGLITRRCWVSKDNVRDAVKRMLFGKLATSFKSESKQTNTAYEYKHFHHSNRYGDLPLADNRQMELIQILSDELSGEFNRREVLNWARIPLSFVACVCNRSIMI